MAVTYPLFVFERDDRSTQIIEDPSHIHILEGVDILRGEYIFWDANGNGVSVAASVASCMLEVGDPTPCPAALALRDAFSICENLGFARF